VLGSATSANTSRIQDLDLAQSRVGATFGSRATEQGARSQRLDGKGQSAPSSIVWGRPTHSLVVV